MTPNLALPLRQLTQFHELPGVIAWWQRRLAPVLTWLTPARRRALLVAGALVTCLLEMRGHTRKVPLPVPHEWPGLLAAGLALIGLCWLVYLSAVRYAALPRWVRSHPQLVLHGLYWGLLVLLWTTAPGAGPLREIFVAVALVFPMLLWRLGYVLLSAQYDRIKGTRFSDHFLTLFPAYGGSNTPYGSGLGYLSRFEARDNEQLARSQLAGLKLFALAGVLRMVEHVFMGTIYGPGNTLTARLDGTTLAIPRMDALIATGEVASAPWQGWLAVYCELIFQVLRHAIRGHEIVAILRLFGFNVFRNTYKPLLAESIVAFWNRYYFYFKELLANFFFLPVFSRLAGTLRQRPALRLFAAVFAAAFIGNTYYHLIVMNEAMAAGAVFEALYSMRSRVFYCLLLALGLFVSMLREQRRGGKAPAGGSGRRLLRIAGVWTFFGLVFIWNVPGGAGFTARVHFFFGLFGLA